MKNNTPARVVMGRVLPFLSLHWFKIGIACLAIYAFLSKDFAFNISIQSPGEPATMPAPGTQSVQQHRKETLTDAGIAQEASATTFDLLPSWSNNKQLALIERLAKLDAASMTAFLQRFQHVAESEQEKFGIPAAITLAHGLLHSQAGQTRYATQGYSFFGISCSDDWQGQTQDDQHGNCLRRYDNAWMSFRDHSLYYTTGPHAIFRQLSPTDHQAWAKALNESPYNTQQQLDQQLLAVIERFSL